MPKKTLNAMVESNNTVVLQVKSNQQFLLDEVDFASNHKKIIDTYDSIEKAHGRIEYRSTSTFDINVPEWEQILIGATIIRKNTNKKYGDFIDTDSRSYYITNAKFTAQEIQFIVRNHWAIEAKHHNIRDTVLFEDANKIRIKPENMMVIRSFGYNLIQANLKHKSFTAHMESNKLNFNMLFEATGVKYRKSVL